MAIISCPPTQNRSNSVDDFFGEFSLRILRAFKFAENWSQTVQTITNPISCKAIMVADKIYFNSMELIPP